MENCEEENYRLEALLAATGSSAPDILSNSASSSSAAVFSLEQDRFQAQPQLNCLRFLLDFVGVVGGCLKTDRNKDNLKRTRIKSSLPWITLDIFVILCCFKHTPDVKLPWHKLHPSGGTFCSRVVVDNFPVTASSDITVRIRFYEMSQPLQLPTLLLSPKLFLTQSK